MAWIHAFVHEMPVSSPQGYVEDALSRASHGGVSDSRTVSPSTKDQVWHSKSERVSLLVPTAKNPPCTCCERLMLTSRKIGERKQNGALPRSNLNFCLV